MNIKNRGALTPAKRTRYLSNAGTKERNSMSDIQEGMSVEITSGDNQGKSMTVDSIIDGMAKGKIDGKDVEESVKNVKPVSTGA